MTNKIVIFLIVVIILLTGIILFVSQGVDFNVFESRTEEKETPADEKEEKENGDEIATVEITDTLEDARDGEEYKTVKIGDRWWFAEDLRHECDNYIETETSGGIMPDIKEEYEGEWISTPYNKCIRDMASDYNIVYYQVSILSDDLCPEGWSIPTDEDWKELEAEVGMNFSDTEDEGWRGVDEGDRLKKSDEPFWCHKDIRGEENPKCGVSEFNALPNGYWEESSFYGKGMIGYWWSSSLSGEDSYWVRHLSEDPRVKRKQGHHYNAFAIRCVK